MEFPNRLGDAREDAGLTQQEAADALGVTVKAYQNYEYGKRELKSGNLIKLSHMYGCTTDYIIDLEDVLGNKKAD